MGSYVGNKIREYRKAVGLTQKELAARVGIMAHTVSMYETGSRVPKTDILAKIATALDCEITDLIPKKTIVVTSPPPGILEKIADDAYQKWYDNDLTEEARHDVDLENSLIGHFHNLNTAGKEKLLSYASDLAQIAAYTAQDSEKGRS